MHENRIEKKREVLGEQCVNDPDEVKGAVCSGRVPRTSAALSSQTKSWVQFIESAFNAP